MFAKLSPPQPTRRRARGSAALTGKGRSWLSNLGGGDLTTEIDERGRRTFKLRTPGMLSYRSAPLDGAISKRALRRGMDRQVSRKR